MAKPNEEFPAFDPAALDALIGDARSPEDFTAVMRALQKRLAERMLAAGLTTAQGTAPSAGRHSAPSFVLADYRGRRGRCRRLLTSDTGRRR